jgi:hypothetical protein
MIIIKNALDRARFLATRLAPRARRLASCLASRLAGSRSLTRRAWSLPAFRAGCLPLPAEKLAK